MVAYPPGGNTDLMARALQPELTRALGQTVVVVNRGGAAGTIGSAELARARPDGYTIAITPNNPMTAQPHAIALTYGLDSFRFLCRVYDNPQVVILGRGAPFSDFAGLVAHGRSAREALVYGAPGNASTQHILMAALLKRAGVEGLMVSFTGAGPMSQAAMGGQIQAFIEASSIPASTGLTPIATVDGAAPAAPAGCADGGGARLPGAGIVAWRADRAGRHSRRGGGGHRACLRKRGGQRGLPHHGAAPRLRAGLPPGCGVPREFRRGERGE